MRPRVASRVRPALRPALPLARLRSAGAGVLLLGGLVGGMLPADAASGSEATGAVYVKPGSGGGDGSAARPFHSIKQAFEKVRPGGTVYLGGGTYRERVAYPKLKPATSSKPVTVQPVAGQQAVIQGVVWLHDPSYWHFKGIKLTWSSANRSHDHMMKITGGTGWSLEGSELWGARSYAALLIAGDASNWLVSRNNIHDTLKTNGLFQDHLIYVNSRGSGGVIAGNSLRNSLNGRAVKVGPSSAGGAPVNGLVIRDNVMDNNMGPSNVQLAWRTSNVQIYGNTMSHTKKRRPAVTAFDLHGTGNVVARNTVWQTGGVMEHVRGLTDGGGNVVRRG